MQPATISNEPAAAALASLVGSLVEIHVAPLKAEIARLRAENQARKARPQWYRIEEVIEILKLSRDTIEDYIKRGLLKKNTLSRHVRIAAEEVDNFRGVACI